MEKTMLPVTVKTTNGNILIVGEQDVDSGKLDFRHEITISLGQVDTLISWLTEARGELTKVESRQ